jgi:hypothetical protein
MTIMHLVPSNDTAPTLAQFTSWQFQASGNYAADCARGRGLARQFSALLQLEDADSPSVLQHLVASIAARGPELTGLETAFFWHLERQIRQPATARPSLSVVSA